MVTAFTIWPAMCGSGALTGTVAVIMRPVLNTIPKVPKKDQVESCVVDRGATPMCELRTALTADQTIVTYMLDSAARKTSDRILGHPDF